MNYDWNWFFSAFVQSSAALIAIIAAFIISKLLGESEKAEIQSTSLSTLLIKRNDLLRQINNRYFNWCDKMTIKHSSELNDAIENGRFDEKSDSEKLELLFNIETDLFRVDNCIDYLNERIDDLAPNVTTINGIQVPIPSPSSVSLSPNIWEELNAEKEKINSLRLESLHIIELFNNQKDSIKAKKSNLKPIKVTIYFLIFGIVLLVIYPMLFLPLEINKSPEFSFLYNNFSYILFSIKGSLLILLFFIINGIFFYFLKTTWKLEKTYNELSEIITKDLIDIRAYSKYFFTE